MIKIYEFLNVIVYSIRSACEFEYMLNDLFIKFLSIKYCTINLTKIFLSVNEYFNYILLNNSLLIIFNKNLLEYISIYILYNFILILFKFCIKLVFY